MRIFTTAYPARDGWKVLVLERTEELTRPGFLHDTRLQLLEVPCHVRGDAADEIEVSDAGWSEDVKTAFADRVIKLAARYLPNLPGAILDRYVVDPTTWLDTTRTADLEVPTGEAMTLLRATCSGHYPATPDTARSCPTCIWLARRRGPVTASTAAPAMSWQNSCFGR